MYYVHYYPNLNYRYLAFVIPRYERCDDDDIPGQWDTWKQSVILTKTVTQFLAGDD